MAPPTLVNLGLRHILVRAPVISSGGSLDKALWKDISLAPPHPPPCLISLFLLIPPFTKDSSRSYTVDRQCHRASVTTHHFPQKASPGPVP